MSNKRLKVFFTCAFGILAGIYVVAEIDIHFWWLGLLIGGLFGYLIAYFAIFLANS